MRTLSVLALIVALSPLAAVASEPTERRDLCALKQQVVIDAQSLKGFGNDQTAAADQLVNRHAYEIGWQSQRGTPQAEATIRRWVGEAYGGDMQANLNLKRVFDRCLVVGF
ncbi:MAG: hypothetical protein U1E23_15495 [Reyranellaceae bacterium]